MKQELVRMNSIDGIEMPGIIYEPETRTNTIVIEVHGLCGSFYENRFIDILAKTYTKKEISLLTFNNRGTNFVAELLQGHSYGCNKVIYYYNNKKDEFIKKLVLLGPCDIQEECKKYLSEEEYDNLKTESAKLVKEGKPRQMLNFSLNGNGKISAGTYYYDFLPNTETDFIRYREGVNSKSKELNNIKLPVLVVFGDMDECVLTQDIEIVKEYLKNNIKECNIQIIKGADYSFSDKYEELGEVINNNI